jgi:hypothetical protein
MKINLTEEIRHFTKYEDGTVGFVYICFGDARGTKDELLERFSWSEKVRKILDKEAYEKNS